MREASGVCQGGFEEGGGRRRKGGERYVASGVSRVGYVVVLEECDRQSPPDFAATMDQCGPGCRVRSLRGWK